MPPESLISCFKCPHYIFVATVHLHRTLFRDFIRTESVITALWLLWFYSLHICCHCTLVHILTPLQTYGRYLRDNLFHMNLTLRVHFGFTKPSTGPFNLFWVHLLHICSCTLITDSHKYFFSSKMSLLLHYTVVLQWPLCYNDLLTQN